MLVYVCCLFHIYLVVTAKREFFCWPFFFFSFYLFTDTVNINVFFFPCLFLFLFVTLSSIKREKRWEVADSAFPLHTDRFPRSERTQREKKMKQKKKNNKTPKADLIVFFFFLRHHTFSRLQLVKKKKRRKDDLKVRGAWISCDGLCRSLCIWSREKRKKSFSLFLDLIALLPSMVFFSLFLFFSPTSCG